MARHALFPETIIESNFQRPIDDESDGINDETVDDAEDELDALLATLDGWGSPETTEEQSSETKKSSNDSSSPLEEVLAEELQAWRSQHAEQNYDEWTSEKKQEFMVSVMFSTLCTINPCMISIHA